LGCCLRSEFPGQLQKILEWFRDYKIPDGKPANAFGYDNKCMDKDFTLKVGAGVGVWWWAGTEERAMQRWDVCGGGGALVGHALAVCSRLLSGWYSFSLGW
jgi:hypothetical protein